MRWFVLAMAALTTLGASGAQLPREYREVEYETASLDDSVARLETRLASGEAELEFDPKHGYLPAVLRELGIPRSSQALVFTKTSFQVGRISPETPRAIYFTDDAYVAWLRDGRELEISAVDPDLGATFYTLRQAEQPRPRFTRQTFLCLRCHDSYSLTGGGVPRHMMGSAVPDANGQPALHEGWYFTDDTTPLERRWGGWYVTGTHGEQRHLGNLIVESAADVVNLDTDSGANVTDLSRLFDVELYLVPHSDIVALMVLEHQVKVQNLMTRIRYDLRGAEKENAESDASETVEPLVRALLLADEAPLENTIAGTSGFAEAFEKKGPHDADGRSLRDLDLETRLFRYPVSYLIYSRSFDALPGSARRYVYRRLGEELSDTPPPEGRLRDLPADTRTATLQILKATKPDFRDSAGSPEH